MSGSMDVMIDEDKKEIQFMAEASGIVKIISYRSASNKTVDRRRVLIKDEREYVIPEGAQLNFDNVMLNSGDDVEGYEINRSNTIISEIDGTVTIKDHYERRTVLLDDDLKRREKARCSGGCSW